MEIVVTSEEVQLLSKLRPLSALYFMRVGRSISVLDFGSAGREFESHLSPQNGGSSSVIEQQRGCSSPYPLVYFVMGRRGLVINCQLIARESFPNRNTCPSLCCASGPSEFRYP